MNQCEIYKHLIELRQQGDNEFRDVTELKKMLHNDCDFNQFRTKVNKLYAYGFLEVFIPACKLRNRYNSRRFRAKVKVNDN